MAATCSVCRADIPAGAPACSRCGFRVDATSGEVTGLRDLLEDVADRIDAGSVDIQGAGGEDVQDEVAERLRRLASRVPEGVDPAEAMALMGTDVSGGPPEMGEAYRQMVAASGSDPRVTAWPGPTRRKLPAVILATIVVDLVIAAVIVVFLVNRG